MLMRPTGSLHPMAATTGSQFTLRTEGGQGTLLGFKHIGAPTTMGIHTKSRTVSMVGVIPPVGKPIGMKASVVKARMALEMADPSGNLTWVSVSMVSHMYHPGEISGESLEFVGSHGPAEMVPPIAQATQNLEGPITMTGDTQRTTGHTQGIQLNQYREGSGHCIWKHPSMGTVRKPHGS